MAYSAAVLHLRVLGILKTTRCFRISLPFFSLFKKIIWNISPNLTYSCTLAYSQTLKILLDHRVSLLKSPKSRITLPRITALKGATQTLFTLLGRGFEQRISE